MIPTQSPSPGAPGPQSAAPNQGQAQIQPPGQSAEPPPLIANVIHGRSSMIEILKNISGPVELGRSILSKHLPYGASWSEERKFIDAILTRNDAASNIMLSALSSGTEATNGKGVYGAGVTERAQLKKDLQIDQQAFTNERYLSSKIMGVVAHLAQMKDNYQRYVVDDREKPQAQAIYRHKIDAINDYMTHLVGSPVEVEPRDPKEKLKWLNALPKGAAIYDPVTLKIRYKQ